MTRILQWATFLLSIAVTCQTNKHSGYFYMENNIKEDNLDEQYHTASSKDMKSCTRECTDGDPPRTCYYKFIVEDYCTMNQACRFCPAIQKDCYSPQCIAADGYERGLVTVNRQLPGPSIQVCEGDRVIVDVKNISPAETVVIHWHGIHQKGTPYSDGTEMISQCPIVENTRFRYNFTATPPGTFYWHTYCDHCNEGLQGSLIVREPKGTDQHGSLYDYDLPDHTILITNWFHYSAEQHEPDFCHPDIPLYGIHYLINGKGRYTLENGKSSGTPLAVFHVHKGKKYRFRIIGGLYSKYEVRLSFQNHKMTIIAIDGNPVEPVVADCIDIYAGMRIDVVIMASNDVKPYWIKVEGNGPCKQETFSQLAVLQYKGPKKSEPKGPVHTCQDLMFSSEALFSSRDMIKIWLNDLQTVGPIKKEVLSAQPDLNFTFTYNYQILEKYSAIPQKYVQLQSSSDPHIGLPDVVYMMNNIYQERPPSPILSQGNNIPSDVFCPLESNGVPICQKGFCRCCQLIKIPLRSVVQITLLDKSAGVNMSCPFHLHGYRFYLMDIGYIKNGLQTGSDIAGHNIIKAKTFKDTNPPLLDTIAVPASGYVVIKFLADNPGVWPLTNVCGMEGMGLIIQVGEPSSFPPVPEGFPKCGNFLPANLTVH